MTSPTDPQGGIRALIALSARYDITEFYERIRYDYAMEASYLHEGHCYEERLAFLSSWGILPPDEAMVLRIFNQINSSYAERWMIPMRSCRRPTSSAK
jgi:hypothetical protein